jgi:catechol 2,3-dioxygenase-like lactoylglutathione lyase family enzyme
MLSNARVGCALPAKDLERAKAFYKEKLDLSPVQENPGGVFYECANGTAFFLFTSSGQSRGDFTQMGFMVDDLRKEVAELKQHGLEFEQYDMPGLKTDADGIADMDGELGAWFKDSEGNLIAITKTDN